MNEVKNLFDYSIVDDRTASFLKVKEQEMRTIVLNGSIQLGDKLIEAQEKLAKIQFWHIREVVFVNRVKKTNSLQLH